MSVSKRQISRWFDRDPTPLEMSGVVNWDRASEFQKMLRSEFQKVPEGQRCGAWWMINDLANIFHICE